MCGGSTATGKCHGDRGGRTVIPRYDAAEPASEGRFMGFGEPPDEGRFRDKLWMIARQEPTDEPKRRKG